MTSFMSQNRWMVVVGALLVQVCLGAIYAWGTFTPALQASKTELALMLSADLLQITSDQQASLSNDYNQLKSRLIEVETQAGKNEEIKAIKKDIDQLYTRINIPEQVWADHYFALSGKETSWIFSVGLITFAIVMIFAGRWQDYVGPRRVALTGTIVLGIGYLLASLAGTQVSGLLITIGFIGGAGIGLAYICPLIACMRWFPDMKGFITGIAVAGFGAGAFLFVKLGGTWGNLIADYGVSYTFMTFGLIFMIAGGIGALFLSIPPEGWKPAHWQDSVVAKETVTNKVVDIEQNICSNQLQCLRTKKFWMIWWSFVFSAGCGLMVIKCLQTFGIYEGGLSVADAGNALGLLALFNGLGRIVWGTVSQKIGVKRALALMMVMQACMMFALYEMGSSVFALTIAACWIGFNFGGNFALFPLMTSEALGTKNLGANYGAVFTAYGVGGILGPVLAGGVWDALGSYFWAFIPAAVACLAAAVLVLRSGYNPAKALA